MLVDVNIPIANVEKQKLELTVLGAYQNGYRGVVLNKEMTQRPAKQEDWDVELFNLDELYKKYKDKLKYGSIENITKKGAFTQLRRITLELEHPSQQTLLQTGPVNSKFDMIAVRPMNEKMFQQACTNLEVDIIELDMTHRASFLYKHTLINAAIARGVVFELKYANCLRDDTLRRYFMHHAANLIRITHGKNIVLGSGALSAMEIRSPADASNLLSLFGLSPSVSRATVTENVRALLVKAYSRTKTHKQVISLEISS